MKYIVIVPDGMADQPLEELGQKTPLEIAHTLPPFTTIGKNMGRLYLMRSVLFRLFLDLVW